MNHLGTSIFTIFGHICDSLVWFIQVRIKLVKLVEGMCHPNWLQTQWVCWFFLFLSYLNESFISMWFTDESSTIILRTKLFCDSFSGFCVIDVRVSLNITLLLLFAILVDAVHQSVGWLMVMLWFILSTSGERGTLNGLIRH